MNNIEIVDSELIGCHISCGSNLVQSVGIGALLPGQCYQMYVSNPRGFGVKNFTLPDLLNTASFLQHYQLDIVFHSSLCHKLTESKIIYSNNSEQYQQIQRKTAIMRQNVAKELDINTLINGNDIHSGGVVIHVGHCENVDIGLNKVAININRILDLDISKPYRDLIQKKNRKLLLENAAGQGTELGTTLDQLQIIYQNIKECYHDNVGFCLDTAHIFGYGEYDIRQTSEIDRLFEDYLIKLGKYPDLIHLNDSKVPLGSKKDRHENLGMGYIFGENLNGNSDALLHLLKFCRDQKIKCILETPGENIESDLFLLKKIK